MDVQQWELATMFPGVAPRQMRIRIIFQEDTGEIALSLVKKVSVPGCFKINLVLHLCFANYALLCFNCLGFSGSFIELDFKQEFQIA